MKSPQLNESSILSSKKIAHFSGVTEVAGSRFASFAGAENIAQCDLLLISMNGLYQEIGSVLGSTDLANNVCSDQKFIALQEKLKARFEIIGKLVQSGATVIILVDHFRIDAVKTHDRGVNSIKRMLSFSGSVALPKTNPLIGAEVKFNGLGSELLGHLFEKTSYKYQWSLEGNNLRPFLVSPSRLACETHTIGAYYQPDNASGVVCLVPPTAFGSTTLEDYVAHLVGFANIICASKQRASVPDWALSLALEDEANSARLVVEHKIDAERFLQLAAALEDQLDACAWHRDLIVGTGVDLEASVIQTLRELGLPAESGPEGRADFIALAGNTVLVGEVKGYDGAAKENCLSQCKRWVSEIESLATHEEADWDNSLRGYAEILRTLGLNFFDGTAPKELAIKGVIVSNNYRSTPLENRPDLAARMGENFSDVLIGNIRRAEVVALTSLQLLGLLSVHRKDSTRLNSLIKELIQTRGVFERLQNWNDFIVSI